MAVVDLFNLKPGGVWPVMLNLGPDIVIADTQTVRITCECGALLDLPHLQDMDTLRLWYGGSCGQCGCIVDYERDDDELHCRTCDTPLKFVSDSEYEEQMYCPTCDPEAASWKDRTPSGEVSER